MIKKAIYVFWGVCEEAVSNAIFIKRWCIEKFLNEKIDITKLIFSKNIYGKPFLIGKYSNLFFNFSHSCEYFAMCISRDIKFLGVDIQKEKKLFNFDKIYKSCMNKRQIRQINTASNPLRTFFKIWTQKEAVSKCLGTGYDQSFKTIDLNIASNSAACLKNKVCCYIPILPKIHLSVAYENLCDADQVLLKIVNFNLCKIID